jgi:hypothetical protein
MSTLSNMPGGTATSLNLTDKIYVAQGTIDRSATIAQVATAVVAGVSSVAGKVGAVTLASTDIGNFAAAASGAAPVQSVASRTGNVTLTTTDIGGFTAAASAVGPVSSVAGKTGIVTLSSTDISNFTAAATAAAPVQTVAGRTGTILLIPSDISGFSATVATAAPVQSVAGRTGAVTLAAGDIGSGTFNPARLASGTPAAGKYPDGAGSWLTLPAGGGGGGTVNMPTPATAGFTVDNTGSADSTAGLNAFFAWCATNHRAGMVPAGTYRTTAELVIPAGHGGIYAENKTWKGTWIKPDNNTYNGLRMVGSFDEAHHRQRVDGFTIASANTSAAPSNGKAAFIVDNSPQAIVTGIQVDNYDIGLDAINNCYDMTWESCYTVREGYPNVNIGFLMREYEVSGADWYCYNMHAGGRKAGFLAYRTGGITFFGCSFGCLSADGPQTNDDYGPIVLGKNPFDGSTPGGVFLLRFVRCHLEGWWYTYAVRIHGESSVAFDTCAFLANQTETGKIARGFLRISNAAGSHIAYNNCDAGWMCKTAGDNLAQIDGWNGGFIMDEHGWTSGGRDWSGGSFFGNWMVSLMEWSNYRGTTDQRGFATWANHDTWRTNIVLNGVYIETNGNSNQLRVGTMNQSSRAITWRTI